jgi:uncharacterized LabA/DUF88 family protein
MNYFGSINGPSAQQIDTTKTHLFVDGNYCLMSMTPPADSLWMIDPTHWNWQHLAAMTSSVSARYYDSLPAVRDDHPDDQRLFEQKERLFARLSRMDDWHAFHGRSKRSRDKRQRQQQKRVDVQLTVDALMSCVQGRSKRVAILAGDDDFLPLIEALVENNCLVTLYYFTNSYSEDMLNIADRSREISLHDQLSLLRGQCIPNPTNNNAFERKEPIDITTSNEWTVKWYCDESYLGFQLFRDTQLEPMAFWHVFREWDQMEAAKSHHLLPQDGGGNPAHWMPVVLSQLTQQDPSNFPIPDPLPSAVR